MHGSILTSGYYSLDSVLNRLRNDGFRCWSTRTLMEKYSKECHDEDILIKGLPSAIDTMSVGGILLNRDEFNLAALAEKYNACVLQTKFVRKFFKEILSKENFKATLFHSDGGTLDYMFFRLSKELGIPTFCILNGTASFNSMLYSPVSSRYRVADFYYLHGGASVDYINERGIDTKYLVTGNPAWDEFYTSVEDREPNTFLYSVNTSYSPFNIASVNKNAYGRMIHESWEQILEPFDIELVFLKAFKLYQETHKEAKLIVSLRPYIGNLTQHKIDGLGIKNCAVFAHEEMPLRKLLLKTSFFITGFSTGIIEGVITNTPTLVLVGNPKFPEVIKPFGDHYRTGECCLSSIVSEGAIYNSLLKFNDKEVVDRMKENCNLRAAYYNYNHDGKATDRVVADLKGKVDV